METESVLKNPEHGFVGDTDTFPIIERKTNRVSRKELLSEAQWIELEVVGAGGDTTLVAVSAYSITSVVKVKAGDQSVVYLDKSCPGHLHELEVNEPYEALMRRFLKRRNF